MTSLYSKNLCKQCDKCVSNKIITVQGGVDSCDLGLSIRITITYKFGRTQESNEISNCRNNTDFSTRKPEVFIMAVVLYKKKLINFKITAIKGLATSLNSVKKCFPYFSVY